MRSAARPEYSRRGWCCSAHRRQREAVTYLEHGFPEETRKRFEALRHRLAPPGNAGGVQAVGIDPESGALMGGSDPRRDGHAIAW